MHAVLAAARRNTDSSAMTARGRGQAPAIWAGPEASIRREYAPPLRLAHASQSLPSLDILNNLLPSYEKHFSTTLPAHPDATSDETHFGERTGRPSVRTPLYVARSAPGYARP